MKEKLQSFKKIIEFITLLVPVVLSVLRGLIGLIELIISLFDSWKDFRNRKETKNASTLEDVAKNFEETTNNLKTNENGSN